MNVRHFLVSCKESDNYFTKKQEIPPKPQLTVYTFPARPQDTVSL